MNRRPEDVSNSSKRVSIGVSMSLVLIVLLIAVWIGYGLRIHSNVHQPNQIASNQNTHNWLLVNEIFDEYILDRLRDITQTSLFETKTIDPYNVESAGEAVPAGHPDCEHPYMNLNGNRTMCHLSSRVDVGNHFVSSGGFEGLMESYDKLVTRMVSFHKKYLDLDNFRMFSENMKLVGQLQDLCYSNYENGMINDKSDIVVDLYQFDLVLLLAGQEIPMHFDVPFFFGADRTTVPQWLLVVMKQSGLFDDLFIPDIKGVAWLTKHNVYNGGHAYLYPYKNDKNKPILFRTQLNEALLFDGTQMIHGSSRFKPEYIPSFFNHDNYYYSIKYNDETKTWHVYDSDNKFSASYTYDDIQISAVWRMHCFMNANEKAKFYAQTTENTRSIEKIAQVFKSALKQKNLLPSGDIKYLDLWTIILKEYISYPKVVPKSKFSLFNYCLLPRIMPDFVNKYFLDFVLSRFC